MFFGTPHKGLVIDDIKKMVAGEDQHPRIELLHQIDHKSDILKYQLADFKNLMCDRRIVSFYETQQTRRLELVIFLTHLDQATFLLGEIEYSDKGMEPDGRLFHGRRL